LNWTGGDDRSVVTVEIISANIYPAPPGTPRLFDTEQGSAGTAKVMLMPILFLTRRTSLDTTSALPVDSEIIVTQQPAALPSLPFTAPGMTLGGEQTWKYVWIFHGL
jgi:hypothetical protein